MAKRPPAYFNDDNPFESIEGRPSKTEQKKEVARLREIAEKLTALSPKQLKQLNLSETTRFEIEECQRFSSFEAKRRQMQRIAKMLRDEDETVLMAALSKSHSPKKSAQLERWVLRMLEQGDNAIYEFCKQFHQADKHTLRQLVLKIERAKTLAESEESIHAHTVKLHNYIRSVAILSED